MVDMCREKKTGMAEECRQSDRKQALRACIECSILLGASGFFQKRCDMITLRFFFQNEPCGVVLDLLYASICSSATLANVVRQRLLMCCFTDSVWSRCTPRYVTVVWKGIQLPSISADSQPTELIRTDEPTSIISVFFCVKLQIVALHP